MLLAVGAMIDAATVINPFGGALEGCFRAYTEKDGPMSKWPGLMLSTGTEVSCCNEMLENAIYRFH